MDWHTTAVVVLSVACVVGCANTLPPKTVSPAYLARFEGGGSLRTIWYRGSDERFHYFDVMHKTTTRYRIQKTELDWEREFPYGSRREGILVGNELSTFLAEETRPDRTPELPVRR